MKLTSSQTIIEKGDLNEGIYLFEVRENGHINFEGKLVIVE